MRTIFSVLLGKLIFTLSRTFKIGGGYAAPGLYALKTEPELVGKLINRQAKNIVITGTNGKTTTSKLISHFLKAAGFKVLHNGSGSNLERGIASYLIQHTTLGAKLDYDFGVWELDEFAFNTVAPKIKPDAVILLNVFRDQLDRYGEIDQIITRWQKTLSKLHEDSILIINGDDANLEKAASAFKGKIVRIGVKGSGIKGESKPLRGRKPDYTAEAGVNGLFESSKVSVKYAGETQDFELPLPGIFNIYNFLSAFTSLYLFNVDITVIRDALKTFKPAFGRFEKLNLGGKQGYIFLIKNPVGATETLKTVLPHIEKNDSLLVALNDNFADGTDVSWIWDIELEKLKIEKLKAGLFVSGTRVFDLALRFKYAGVSEARTAIEADLEKALDSAIERSKGKLFIFPTYTALLALQKILAGRGIKKEYWRNE
jgi:lipid II isoglutaminyl synthase (glutamine-hydrolysing)